MKKFEELNIEEIVEYNKIECGRRKESFGVKMSLLYEIFDKVNELERIEEAKRVLSQASTLVGLIVFWQPFSNANKSTATAAMLDFLASNGYELDLSDSKRQQEFVDLLERVVYLFEDESQKGVEMLKFFLERYMKRSH